jgi:hypothetical protein
MADLPKFGIARAVWRSGLMPVSCAPPVCKIGDCPHLHLPTSVNTGLQVRCHRPSTMALGHFFSGSPHRPHMPSLMRLLKRAQRPARLHANSWNGRQPHARDLPSYGNERESQDFVNPGRPSHGKIAKCRWFVLAIHVGTQQQARRSGLNTSDRDLHLNAVMFIRGTHERDSYTSIVVDRCREASPMGRDDRK